MKCETENILGNTAEFAAAFRGVLMDQLVTDYAENLHAQVPQPYSQNVTLNKERTELIWTVNTLTEEAREKIIAPLSRGGFDSFRVRNTSTDFAITKKTENSIPLSSLTNGFYGTDTSKLFSIAFRTPTAFGSNGKYVFVPYHRFVIQSLMQKYAYIAEDSMEVDSEMLEAITASINLLLYRVKSTKFHLESMRIPAFTGTVTFKVSGARTIANYINMLLRFGEYSGVGIKTSMGMGALAYNE